MIKLLLSTVLLLLMVFSSAFSQVNVPAESKFQISKLLNASVFEGKIAFLAKVKPDFEKQSLNKYGIILGSQIADIITLQVPQSALQYLPNVEGIDFIQIAEKTTPQLSKVIPDIRADSVYMGINLETGYTGENVIIGIADWGFDYTHPMFYDSAMKHTRILAAWDQFKTSGPAPDEFDYGTEYIGETELLNAKSDTINIYEYATHGTHVAGIAAGGGAGTIHRGVAYNAELLMVTFLVDEAAVLDAFAWMKHKADSYKKRLIINMSWGLHYIGTLDGNSLLSQAIDAYSAMGVVFVTSGGNNGNVRDHIKHSFKKDTLKSQIEFYPYNAHPKMWGQSVSCWGEKDKHVEIGFTVYNSNKSVVFDSDFFSSKSSKHFIDTFCVIVNDTLFYNLTIEASHHLNQRPHIRLRIKNKNTALVIALKSTADSGLVHFWNIVELTNGVGNWGLPFTDYLPGWLEGDNEYAIDEPACAKSVITVAAHTSELKLPNGNVIGGVLANFSSLGPTLDNRIKPDISAPGVNVASAISSFTNNNYTLLQNVNFNGKDYPFARFSGTSMSSPATAGTVALMLEANASMFPVQIKDVLQKTARFDVNTGVIPVGGNTTWGAGKLNAFAAVKEAELLRPVIPNESIPPTYKLFPNPTKNQIFYFGAYLVEYNAKIYSMEGKMVGEGMIGELKSVDISFLSKGLYFIHIFDAPNRVLPFIVIQ